MPVPAPARPRLASAPARPRLASAPARPRLVPALSTAPLDESRRAARAAMLVVAALILALGMALLGPAATAHASSVAPAAGPALSGVLPMVPNPVVPDAPTDPTNPLQVTIEGESAAPSTSLIVLVGMTVLAIAPSLLLMTTSFLKILVVLSLTRNALGLQGVPPNQVLSGIALFLSLFIMAPVVGELRAVAIDPFLAGDMDFLAAMNAAMDPLRVWMLGLTREEDIALLTRAAELPNPATPADVPMTTLVPAFMLSELRAAFVIGFVIFVPFVVIDLVVGATLMSVGMMMLPPVMISLPFKILLMVLVDGWGLIVTTLVGSYQ